MSFTCVRKSLLAFGCVVSLGAVAHAADPLSFIKQKNDDVTKLLKQKPEPNSSAEKKQKQDIKSLAGSLLDYEELAKRSLAEHWQPLSKAQRDDFVATLRGLIERNYVKQLQSNLEYKVDYKKEDVEAGEATVTSVVKVKTEGKPSDVEIVYKLHKTDADNWLVYDVITDESSLVRNYRGQFNKVISEKSYAELLRRMKAKLKETGPAPK